MSTPRNVAAATAPADDAQTGVGITPPAGTSLGSGRPAPARTAQEKLQRALADTRRMAWRNLVRARRSPEKLMIATIEPVMIVLLFRYLFGGAIEVPNGSYVDFLLPGILVLSAAFASAATAIGLAEDVSSGIVDRFRAMPVARSAVLLGRLVFDTTQGLFVVILMALVGFAVGWRVHAGVVPFIAAILLADLFGVALCTISALCGLAIRDLETVQSFGLVWMFPLTFMSSAFVPVVTMPGWLQPAVKVNPITIWTDTLRHLTLGGPTTAGLVGSLAWTFAILVVFAPLAVRAYRRHA